QVVKLARDPDAFREPAALGQQIPRRAQLAMGAEQLPARPQAGERVATKAGDEELADQVEKHEEDPLEGVLVVQSHGDAHRLQDDEENLDSDALAESELAHDDQEQKRRDGTVAREEHPQGKGALQGDQSETPAILAGVFPIRDPEREESREPLRLMPKRRSIEQNVAADGSPE